MSGLPAAIVHRLRARMRHMLGSGPAPVHVLLLSDGLSAHSEAQFDPVFRHRDELLRRFGVVVRHRRLVAGDLPSPNSLRGADIVGFKLYYRTPPDGVMSLARHLAGAKPPSSVLVYCDGNDDVTIQWPGLLRLCDLYWKKHMLRDRTLYQRHHRGSTNLTEYASAFTEVLDRETGHEAFAPASSGDLRKFVLGACIGLDDKIAALRPLLERPVRRHAARRHDVVLRADVPDNWMGVLRRPAVEALRRMQRDHRILLPEGRVPQGQYDDEMGDSRMCVSPFGYGEICWRDFESVAHGCLLLKPDMGHVVSRPDIFQPFATYIPLAWDYSDLPDKLRHYAARPEEAVRIADRARAVLLESLQSDWFRHVFGELLQAARSLPAIARQPTSP